MTTKYGCVDNSFKPEKSGLNECTLQNQISIAWRNLQCEVTAFDGWKWKKKCILPNLTGHFCAGTLNGLLGPSGAGKTTLLNCLSGSARSELSKNTELYLNTGHINSTAVSYYIRQHVHESIVGELTVGQILQYAFAFKNGTRNSNEMHQHIKATMAALLLPPDLESQSFAQCSGGEQKRVAIAQELMTLTAPSFLFLDEPTTGLDSASAYQVMLCLQKLAQIQNITIIASIHAPNDETLNLFDKLYVLAKGGICIYSGPPTQIQSWLENEIQFNISSQQPPIEVVLKIACNGTQDSNVVKLALQTQTNEISNFNFNFCNIILQPNGLPTSRKCFSINNFVNHLFRQFRIAFIAKIKAFLFIPVIFTIYFLLISTIFDSQMAIATGCYRLENSTTPNATCDIGESSESSLHFIDLVRENDNYLGFVLFMIGLLIILNSVILYRTQIKIFQNEHRNHWYSLGVFYWSTNIISFIELSFMALLVALYSYFLSNQHAADHYAINWTRLEFYFLFLWLFCFFYQSIGQLIGIIFVNYPNIAILIGELIYTSICLFNGIYIKLHRTESALIEHTGEWLSAVYITRGIFYSIYGIDRCDKKTEFSKIIRDHKIEVNQIGIYVAKVLINIALVKCITFIVMYCKFNDFGVYRSKKKGKLKLENTLTLNQITMMNGSNGNLNITESTHIELKGIEKTLEDNNKLLKGKIVIAWKNLHLYGTSSIFEMGLNNTNRPLILQNLSGQFQFGTLNALMGTSGAGKTSLLRVLNGQFKTRLGDETKIYLTKFTTINTCFITQEVSNHLMPGLTAKEMLIYASKLKNLLCQTIDHEMIATKWLQELDLIDIVETIVDNCSGGERKRLAVALELTSFDIPNLICIDEPTSGLDSNSAEIVISTLQKLSQNHPITIITSIHQPTTEILFMFDQLYVLAHGGVCIYSGSSNQINAHLNQIHELSQSISHYPIETLIKQSCSDKSNLITQQLIQLNANQTNLLNDIDLLEQTQLTTDGVLLNRPRFSFNSVLILSSRFLLYIRGYLWKEWLTYIVISNLIAINLRVLFPVKIIYPNGCISFEDDINHCTKTERQIEDELLLADNVRYNYLAVSITQIFVLAFSGVSFSMEFPYFANEHQNGWYSTGSYYLMKSTFEIIPFMLSNFIFVYIFDIYDPVVSTEMYWQLFFTLTLAQFACAGMAHCFALLAGCNIPKAMTIAVPIYFLFSCTSNCFLPFNKMHYIWQFISNFAIVRFLYESFLLQIYGFGRCKQKEVQAILYSMSLDDSDLYFNIYMFLFNIIIFRIFAMFLLLRAVNSVENRKKRVLRIVKFQEILKQNTTFTTGV